VKSLGGLSDQQVGWALAIPYACATLAMVLWGRHSDRAGERKWHLALPGVVGTIGFVWGAFAGNYYLAIAGFTLGAIGIYASLPVFWSLPTALLGGTAAAGGIALINSIGNLAGGGFGPYVIGKLKDRTQDFTAGVLVIAASLALAAVLGYVVGRRVPKPS
jgi:ACS family tartrate transporter-like MFS transporter